MLLSGNVDDRCYEPIGLARPVPETTALRKQPTPAVITDAIFTFKTRCAALEVIAQGEIETRFVIGMNFDLRKCRETQDFDLGR